MPNNPQPNHFAYICNSVPFSAITSEQTNLPLFITEHNRVNPLSVTAMQSIADRGEFISCTEHSGGSYTENTHDDLASALAEINGDNCPHAYAYTTGYNIAGDLLLITFNKP